MESRRRLLVALALAVICLLLFVPTAGHDFINYDDNGYVTENPAVRAGLSASSIRWAFTTVDYFYWQPFTWLSHMLDVEMFGLSPGGHHFTSAVLHAVNAGLAVVVLFALTGAFWRSAAAAALFALHPLRVESVAWVAERKDLLSAFWFLVALGLYVHFVRRPSRGGYYLVVLAFALGLMSKPMLMTMPILLLLLDWWPLKRRAFAEKMPLFGLALVSASVTSIGTVGLGSVNWGASLTLGQRISNMLVSYVKYLELTFWPHDLALLYPFRTAVPVWQAAAAALLLVTIAVATRVQARKRPYLIVGWLWFAFALLPAAGIMQVGRQGMADRFTYLPHLGLAIAVVWGGADLLGSRAPIAAAVAALLLAIATARQLPVWRNSVTAFTHALAVTSNNPAAHHYLSAALDDRGRYDEALPHHAEAVRLEPSYFVAQCAYGEALVRKGQLEPAIEHFELSLRYMPSYTEAKKHLEAARKSLDLSKASGLKLESGR